MKLFAALIVSACGCRLIGKGMDKIHHVSVIEDAHQRRQQQQTNTKQTNKLNSLYGQTGALNCSLNQDEKHHPRSMLEYLHG